MDNKTPADPNKEKQKTFGEQLANDITSSGKAFVKKSTDDLKNAAKQTAWNTTTGFLDILFNNLKKSINSVIFPDGSGPSVGTGGGSSEYRDYAGYSNPNRYKSAKEDIGNRSAKDLKLITFRSKADAEALISDIFKVIDTSSNNCCRVGDLYDMVRPKITSSMADWKYGWTNEDKGRFDTRYLASGIHAGEWMIIFPEPHLV